MADLVWLIGDPRNELERTAWAMAILTSFGNPEKAQSDKAVETLRTAVTQGRTMSRWPLTRSSAERLSKFCAPSLLLVHRHGHAIATESFSPPTLAGGEKHAFRSNSLALAGTA